MTESRDLISHPPVVSKTTTFSMYDRPDMNNVTKAQK